MGQRRRLEQTRRSRGLVSSRVSGARVIARFCPPPDDLADVVETFWAGAWDLREQPDHTTELIADPAVHVVFEDGASRVVGVWTRLWTRTLSGQGLVRAVKLRPGAARAFLPEPATTYSNRMTPLREVFGDEGGVCAAVLAAVEDAPAFEVLADWLRARRREDDQVVRAVALMARIRAGVPRVEALADEAGVTVRTLQRLFRSHVGATPKWVIRWFRLQEVAQRVESGDAPDLASLAITLGYADQAHLARDFRAATGKTLRGFEDSVHR